MEGGESMKAAQIKQYGGPEVVEINEAAEKPAVGEGQVLVAVHASSINPIDWKVRRGYLQQMVPLQFPVTLGGDIAGTIAEVGENVIGFTIGDNVYGQASILGGGSGAYAEYATTKATQIAKMPEGLDFTDAAALPLTGLSALQVIEDHIHIQAGQKILIHGGAGGIGSIAIQIAKHHGAYITTTASKESAEYVKQLGADEVIDYKTQQFEDVVHDYDAVFDTVGGETYQKSFTVLKKGGIIVSMVEQPNEELAKKHEVTALMQMTKTTTESLTRLVQLVKDGVITVHIDKIFPLDQIQEAFTVQESGGVNGKIVVIIK
jgi:NADPH:quinone reductase-like Zn-dependent oxidoreductase